VLFGPAGAEPGERRDVGWFERIAVMLTLVVACLVLFRYGGVEAANFHSLYYIPIPLLVWAAVRLGPRWSFAASLIIALMAVWNTSRGYGPFADTRHIGEIMDLQAFLLLSLTPVALLATAIAEHRRDRDALRESEEKYRLLVNHAGDMVVKVDPEGRFVFVSPQYCRVFGKSEEELLGHTFLPLVHEDDRVSTEKAMESLMAPPHTCYIEQRAMTRNGWRWIAWRDTAILDAHGNVETIIGVGRDIQSLKEADEERERLRERLNRAEKMEALNLLAGGVAHDLNNILSGLISYPDLLLLDLPEDSDLREPLETIRESGFRAAAVVRDMAGLSRVMDINASLIPANLSRIMTEYLASSEHEELMQRYPDVKVDADLDPGVLSVSCAPVQMRRAVSNLVLNAIEIADAGSTVTVRTENRYVDAPMKVFEEIPAGEYVALEVVDSGKQVSTEDLPRIFDPFFTRKVLGWGGTGLGLTVVWNVVHDHGGYVDVVSCESGTTFTLYLPATRAVVPDPSEAELVQDYRGNGEHILVVDDEPAQRRIAKHILERLNYRVETEESGEAAIKHLESFPVDLVVLDMIMPLGMDGEETYRHLCELHPGLKAVVASGFAHVDAIHAMQEAGVNRYIEKPYTMARLGREVYAELHSEEGE
jgi:PAS domain S-box-containing protein